MGLLTVMLVMAWMLGGVPQAMVQLEHQSNYGTATGGGVDGGTVIGGAG